MKRIIVAMACMVSAVSFAQLSDVNGQLANTAAAASNDTIEGWKKGGTFTFLLNQSAFSNWIAGGNNNIAGNANVNYDINYRKGDWTWDNKIILAYGLSRVQDQDTRKTDDRIELNSLLGKKAWGNWSYSFFANFRTQFTDGFDYDNDPNEQYHNSGFMNPGYLTFGPGLMWRKNDNLKFNFAPATSKMTFIGDELFMHSPDDPNANGDGFVSSNDVELFGVDPGKNLRYELGMFASGYYKFNLMQNVSVENILNLYSNYLEDPQNVDLDYTLNVVMQINKYLSTNLSFQTIYDDNAFEGFQVRQVFGLGVNMNF